MPRVLGLTIGLFLLVASSAGAAWGPASDLSTGAVIVAPRLAVATNGTIGAIWQQGSSSAQDIVAATRPSGGPWTSPQIISGGADTSSPQLGSDAAGDMVAAWLENGFVRVATRPAGGIWQPLAVPLSGSSASAPALAVAADGTAVVTWIEGSLLKVSTRVLGSPFSAPATVNTGTSPSYPSVAAGPSSDFLLVWSDTNGGAGRVMTSYRPAGGPFAAPVSVLSAAPGAGVDLYLDVPQAVFNSAGEASVTWLRYVVDNNASQTTAHWEAKWRGSGAAGTWSPQLPTPLQTVTFNSTNPQALHPQVQAADTGGRTVVVFRSLDTTDDLYSTRASGTANGFSAAQAISGATASRYAVAAAGSTALYVEPSPFGVALAPAGSPFGALDGSPLAAAGTVVDVAAGGDTAGDGWIAFADDTGSTSTLRWQPDDVTAPEARSLAIPATATLGQPVAFSVAPWDALTGATASWSFGDGASGAGSAVQHTYAAAGPQTVTVTVTDGVGNTATASGVVTVAPAPVPPAPGGSTPPPPVVGKDVKAPVLTKVRVSPNRFRRPPVKPHGKKAAALRWTLSERATLRVRVTRVGTRKTIATLTIHARAGAAHLLVARREAPRAGRYHVRLVATDAAGNRSRAVTVTFTVRR